MPTWIRVRDDKTGHEYDIEESSLRPGMTVLKDHPKLSGPGALPRPAKVRVEKDGAPTDEAPAAQPATTKRK